MRAASAEVTPISGMAVPGWICCGCWIQRTRFFGSILQRARKIRALRQVFERRADLADRARDMRDDMARWAAVLNHQLRCAASGVALRCVDASGREHPIVSSMTAIVR